MSETFLEKNREAKKKNAQYCVSYSPDKNCRTCASSFMFKDSNLRCVYIGDIEEDCICRMFEEETHA